MAAPLLCPPVSAGLLLTYSQFYVGYAEPLRVKLAALYEVTDGSQVTPRKLRGYSDQAYLWQYSDETLSDVCRHLDDAANNSGLPLNWPSDSPFRGRSRALDSYIRNLRQQVGAYLDLDTDDPKRKELCLDIEITHRTCLTITQIGGDIRSLLARPEWKAFLRELGDPIDMLSAKGWLTVNAANDAWYAEQDWRKKLTAIAHKIRQELNASIGTDLSPLEEAALELMGASCDHVPGQQLIQSYLQIADPLLGYGIDCGELAVDCDLLKGLAKGMANAGHNWSYQGLFVEMSSTQIPKLIPGFTFDPSAGNASLKLATAIEKLVEPLRARPTQEQIDPQIEQLRDGLCGLTFSSRKLLEVASETAKDNTPIRQLNEDSQVSDKDIEHALQWFWEDIDRSQAALACMRPNSVAIMCEFSRKSVWSLDLKRILDKMTDWVRFTRSQKYGIDAAAFRSAVRFGIPDWQQYQAELHAQQELLGTLASSPADIDRQQTTANKSESPESEATDSRENNTELTNVALEAKVASDVLEKLNGRSYEIFQFMLTRKHSVDYDSLINETTIRWRKREELTDRGVQKALETLQAKLGELNARFVLEIMHSTRRVRLSRM